jgi:ribonuclease D
MLAMPSSDPISIDHQKEFSQMVQDIQLHSLLAVDTESNSLYVYREQVCLLQFSTGEKDYLVDTLSSMNLSMLGPIFADEGIEKVFHAAEYDLICLKRDFGFEFNQIFDTMHAARILGRKNVGLASILESEFQINLQKKYQRANWGKRPLIPEMLNYARLDSHFLIPLRNKLKGELVETGLLTLAEEDFKRLTAGHLPNGENGGSTFWRVAGSQRLTPIQTSILQELCRFREQRARESNLPPFKILGNQTLLDITLAKPRSMKDLGSIHSLNDGKAHRYGEGLLKAVEMGLAGKPARRPARTHPGEPYLGRLENLRQWRMKTARALDVESDVVLPRDVLERVAMQNPGTIADLAEVMKDTPWRYQQYGEQILLVISGNAGDR